MHDEFNKSNCLQLEQKMSGVSAGQTTIIAWLDYWINMYYVDMWRRIA